METDAIQALVRFGLGRRGSQAPPTDPQTWLLAQLDGPDPARWPHAMPTVADGLLLQRAQNRLLLGGALVKPLLDQEMRVQTEEVLTTDSPFRERLVWFWVNHFTVSLRAGGGVASTIGPFIRDAIRPNVTGPFLAMLLAVMRHPAMLLYLDNAASVGPNSPVGQRSHKGLNENLARECLELHTLSPASGYTQTDVTEFAKVITGWGVDVAAAQPGFAFRADAHEPGEKTVLGRKIPPGEVGGLLALEFLASHPATHRHLAIKLARHFVADDPPPAVVRPIEAALRDSGGDLGSASRALVMLPAAWRPLAKFRAPQDFAIAALRLMDLPADKRPTLQSALGGLGQPLWNAPFPIGWPDHASDWAGPEAMMQRVEWAYGLSGHLGEDDPLAMADLALGNLLRPDTLALMRAAGSRRDALTMLFCCPEFQRR
jgi:uncharacterized protein (DUF1800 family)